MRTTIAELRIQKWAEQFYDHLTQEEMEYLENKVIWKSFRKVGKFAYYDNKGRIVNPNILQNDF